MEHLKAYSAHKVAGAAKLLIKCSTCGVEFSSLKEERENLKAHPEHKMAPE